MERVHPVPRLRRRDQPDHLLDECDRVAQRPLPSRGQGSRALPQRCRRAEVPVLGDTVAWPHRPGSGTLGDEVEVRAQRLRDHLRRPNQLTMRQVRSTANLTHPPPALRAVQAFEALQVLLIALLHVPPSEDGGRKSNEQDETAKPCLPGALNDCPDHGSCEQKATDYGDAPANRSSWSSHGFSCRMGFMGDRNTGCIGRLGTEI